jgi:hypothetical protein
MSRYPFGYPESPHASERAVLRLKGDRMSAMEQLFREIGGGLPAVVMLGLGWLCWKFYQDGLQQREARITDMRYPNKPHQDLPREMARTLPATRS